jgi:predicted DNA-binding ribbon-helix-helix protein
MRAGKFVLQAIVLMAVLVWAQAASAQAAPLTELVQHIDQGRDGRNLSSAIRVFVFNHLRAQIAGTKIRLFEETESMDRASADDHAQ